MECLGDGVLVGAGVVVAAYYHSYAVGSCAVLFEVGVGVAGAFGGFDDGEGVAA